MLDTLLTSNFLTTPPGSPAISRSDLPGVGGKGQVVIALSGGRGEPAVAPQDFFVPFVQELVQRGVTVAAGESADTAYPFVPVLRSDGGAGDGSLMVTVDDLDFSVGGAALSSASCARPVHASRIGRSLSRHEFACAKSEPSQRGGHLFHWRPETSGATAQ